jgi:nuclease-like protein
MDAIVRTAIPGGLSLLVLSAVLGLIRLQRRAKKTRAPIEWRLLRSPGESCRARLERIDEKLMWCVALLMAGPMAFGLCAPGFPDRLSISLLVAVIGLCVAAVYFGVNEYRACSLGLMGERAVGEELNQLMVEGCRVFHDYPGGPKGSIDHIVVAPTGVYAIATRTRRKRRAPKGESNHELTFDGKKLHFPRSISTRGVEDARGNAAELSRELTEATGETVQVKAILTVPGWHISRTGKSDVSVLNPKEIRQAVLLTAHPTLSPDQIQAIAQQVEWKCRDVAL